MEKILEKNLEIINKNESFIAHVLHDIKSPLYSIKIGLEPNLTNELNKEIYKTTLETLSYIEKFLQNYNFKNAKYSFNFSKINLIKLINDKIKCFKYIFDDKNIDINLKYNKSEDFSINQVEILLSSIIGNIISNICFHASNNSSCLIELMKNEENIYILFENYFDINTNDTLLGLDFCKKISEKIKAEFDISKIKNKYQVKIKIPNLD